MGYEMKEGDFTLFRNEKKEGQHPDYTGKCFINGKTMRLAAWVKEGESGKKFFSGKISDFTKEDYPKKQVKEDGDLPF